MVPRTRFWDWQDCEAHKTWVLEASPGDGDWLWSMSVRLRRGEAMAVGEWRDPPPTLVYTTVKAFVDQPLYADGSYVVSSRLRRFFESEAPGHLEFLPVRLSGPGADKVLEPYWLVNFLRAFDCLDPVSYDPDPKAVYYDGRRRVQFPVIDPRRVPDDGLVGVVRGYEFKTIVRDDLKRKIVDAGFTCVGFLDWPHSDIPGLPKARARGRRRPKPRAT